LRLTDEQKDVVRKTILGTLKKGYVHWTDLKRKVFGTCQPFISDSSFNSQMRYLMKKGFIKKVERGIYQITEAGEKYYELLKPNQ